MTSVCACHGLPVILNPPRCRLTGHRQPVNGVPPRETRELVLAAGLAGVVVAFAELRDRRRARLAGQWTGLRAAEVSA